MTETPVTGSLRKRIFYKYSPDYGILFPPKYVRIEQQVIEQFDGKDWKEIPVLDERKDK